MPTNLKLQLILANVSQTQIANQAGISLAYVNRVVNGKQKPSKKVQQAIKKLTGLSPEILFKDGKK